MQTQIRTEGGLAGTGEASSAYSSPDAACIQGFAEIKANIWHGALADASAEYAGGNSCRIHRNGETITWFSISGGVSGSTTDVPTLATGYKAVTTANGASHVFEDITGQWIDPLNPAVKLVASGINWIFTDNNNTQQTYNADGQLISITPPNGRTTTLIYNLPSTPASGDDDPETLDQVTDASGRSLFFHYTVTSGIHGRPRLTSVTTPDGDITYMYDGADNLKSVTYPDSKIKTYHYENPNFTHHLTGITDEKNIRYATWSYNADGKAETSEHAGGVDKVTFVYNADGTTTVNGALGDSRTYHFEVQNGARVVSQITGDQCTSCGNGHMQTRSYDANGFLNGYTDWAGNQTSLIKNTRGLVESRTEAVGTPEERTTTTVWHPDFNLPTQISESGKTTDFVYNSNSQLLSRTVTDTATTESRTTTATYHPAGSNGEGLIASLDGPRTDVNDVTTYGYDANDNLISISNALGHITQVTAHDPSGRPLTLIDSNGVQTDLSYDARGRLLTHTLAAGTTAAATTTLVYDNVGNVTKIILPSNNELSYSYDAAQRLTRITDRQGHFLDYSLDAMGNRTQEDIFDKNNVLRSTQSRVFDQLSRLTQTIGGENQTTTYGYDNNGNQTALTDPLTRNHGNAFDGLDRLIRSVDPDLKDTSYSYDARGNLTAVTDPRGLTTAYSYNGFDDLIQLDSPDTGITTYTYDAADNRSSQTDARGVVTNYHYDALNRLTQIEYPGQSGLNVDYLYDTGNYGIGRLREMQDNTGRTIYFYNVRGDLIRERRVSQGTAYDTKYAYDKAGNVTKITYPSGKEIQIIYNSLKRIREVKLNDGSITTTLATGIVYRPFGPMQKLIYGNGLTNTQAHDLAYRAKNNRTLPIQDQRFIYDAADNITSLRNIINTSQHQDFGYDNLDRLTNADGGYGLIDFSYDPVGNRLSKTDNGTVDSYSYATSANRLTGITDSSSTDTSYQYTANGSIRKIGANTFGYSKTGRLASATIDGQKTTYHYNGKGERTLKTAPDGTKTLYHYDTNGQLIAETATDGTPIREYVYLNGQPLVLLENGNSYYYHVDHLGTPQSLTDQNQSVVWLASYDPFGRATTTTEYVTNNIRFPGQYYDAESGLHYNYFRYYDPITGRYMTSDPIGLAGGINTYAYVGGNPISWYDLFGLETIYTKDGIKFVSYPKPNTGTNRGEHTTQIDGRNAYHTHVNGHPKKRWDVYNNRPLTDEDASNFSKKELKVCQSLSENEQRYLKRATREVFHHNPQALPRLRTRYLTTFGAIFGPLMSNTYEETCAADKMNDLDDVCN